MPDIFNITQQAVAADFARGDTFTLTVGAGGDPVALAQNVTVSYNRPLQPIYELGGPDISMSMGRPEGTLQIARVIGNRDGGQSTLLGILGEDFTQIQGVDGIGGTLTLQPLGGTGLFGGTGKQTPAYKCSGCFVIGEQFGGAAQDVVIIESVQIQFISLELES